MAESEIVWFKLTVENPKEPESISDLIKQFLRFYYTTNLRRGVALYRTGKSGTFMICVPHGLEQLAESSFSNYRAAASKSLNPSSIFFEAGHRKAAEI